MNEMTHLTADELKIHAAAVAAKSAPAPTDLESTYGLVYLNDEGAGVPIGEIYDVDLLGYLNLLHPGAVIKLLADINAARAKLAALAIEHEHAMQALMLGEDEAKKELLAARAKLAKLLAERSFPTDAMCVFKDGDQFVCVLADFVNLQESPAAFGKTRIEAIEAFEKTGTDELCDRCYGTGEDEYDKDGYCPDCKGFGTKDQPAALAAKDAAEGRVGDV